MTSDQDQKNPTLERPKLQKFLADAGLCSRRIGENWIQEGRVTINGNIARLGARVSPMEDTIKLNGKVVRAQHIKTLTVAINKPKGYTCSNHDEFADRLIFELPESAPTNASVLCRSA